jgi:hypothetical protein
MLSAVYKEFEWLPWKFVRGAGSYWDSIPNQRLFLDWVGKHLGIKEFSDWYNVKMQV